MLSLMNVPYSPEEVEWDLDYFFMSDEPCEECDPFIEEDRSGADFVAGEESL